MIGCGKKNQIIIVLNVITIKSNYNWVEVFCNISWGRCHNVAVPLNGNVALQLSNGQELTFDVFGAVAEYCFKPPPGFPMSVPPSLFYSTGLIFLMCQISPLPSMDQSCCS